jgi:toxin ParE1/3/4
MPHLIILLPAAEADLAEISRNYEDFGSAAYDGLILAIRKRFKTLSQFPEVGRACEDLAPNLRAIFVKGFAIFYLVRESKIDVARIIDARRNLPEIWRETV